MSSVNRMGVDYCQPGHEGGATMYGKTCVAITPSVGLTGALSCSLLTFTVWGTTEKQVDENVLVMRLKLNGRLN